MLSRANLLTAALFAGLIILPLVSDDSYLRHVSLVAILYAVLVSNWNVTLGYAGVFNFGHMAFFAIGAYTAAILTKQLGFSHWWGFPAGIGASVIASIIVCVPVLRLKGIYVVLVTFAFSQLCYQVVLNQRDITGGTFGIVSIPPLQIGSFSFADNANLGYYYFALALLALSTAYLTWLIRSEFGRSVIALRDNEDYAIARGVALSRVRLLTFIASAIFPGAVGVLYAYYVRSASPDLFGFSLITLGLSMLILGGLGTIWGPIIGAAVLTIVSELLAPLGPGRFLVIAAMIIIVLRFLPGGLVSVASVFRGGRAPPETPPLAPPEAPPKITGLDQQPATDKG